MLSCLVSLFQLRFNVDLSCCCAHRDGVPTFTRQPQILIKDAKSNEPIAVLDIGFQSVFHPTVKWNSPKGELINEDDHMKIDLIHDGKNTFTSQLQIKNYLAKDNGKYTCLIKNQSGLIAVEMTLEIEECIKMEPKKTNDAKCEEPEKAADVKKSEKHEEKKADKTGEV
ncbi:Disorganized muscle protein 1 [Toxocara canis]|uniref:Disorganized muscle protein 1 n=1 Tax=Toxocara canis TaxID=6265 RepID=A0A0B2V7W2_TOXCA|nr:Disorganized muscle protein 1 [Toxocara canis]